MQLFFSASLENDLALLDESENHHARHVLRLRDGDRLFLTNGKGMLATGILDGNRGREGVVRVESKEFHFQPFSQKLHLLVSPPKSSEKWEWMVEKCIEIGVDSIQPLLTQRSYRQRVNLERTRRLALSAMKQSNQVYLTEIREPVSFQDFMDSTINGQGFIAYCEGETQAGLWSLIEPDKDGIVLIGPEGDFSPEEVGLSAEKGFQAVGLGPTRLRVETAALVAVHTFRLRLGSQT